MFTLVDFFICACISQLSVYNKIPKTANLLREKVSFGSEVWQLQSIINWFQLFWICGTAAHNSDSTQQSKITYVTSLEANVKRKGLGLHCSLQICAFSKQRVSYHVLPSGSIASQQYHCGTKLLARGP